jgi:hypothetical protein
MVRSVSRSLRASAIVAFGDPSLHAEYGLSARDAGQASWREPDGGGNGRERHRLGVVLLDELKDSG